MSSRKLVISALILTFTITLLVFGISRLYADKDVKKPVQEARLSANKDIKKPVQEKTGAWTNAGRIVLPAELKYIVVYEDGKKYKIAPSDQAFNTIRRVAEPTILSYNAIPKLDMTLDEIEHHMDNPGVAVVVIQYGDRVRIDKRDDYDDVLPENYRENIESQLYIVLDAQPSGNCGMFFVSHNGGYPGAYGTAKSFLPLKGIVQKLL